VRDEQERKNKRIERNKVEKGCNVIVASVKEMREEKFEREYCYRCKK
jgi:hypothetical protein